MSHTDRYLPVNGERSYRLLPLREFSVTNKRKYGTISRLINTAFRRLNRAALISVVKGSETKRQVEELEW